MIQDKAQKLTDAGNGQTNDQLRTSLWRRWLQPLETVQNTTPAPISVSELEDELTPHLAAETPTFRKALLAVVKAAQIGRASCRERV